MIELGGLDRENGERERRGEKGKGRGMEREWSGDSM